MDDKKKTVQVDIEFISVWEVDATADEETVKREIFLLMQEYLTSKESVLYGDYGKGAWGGYDGPFLVKSRAVNLDPTPQGTAT
jgi:hypothetical protein